MYKKTTTKTSAKGSRTKMFKGSAGKGMKDMGVKSVAKKTSSGGSKKVFKNTPQKKRG